MRLVKSICQRCTQNHRALWTEDHNDQLWRHGYVDCTHADRDEREWVPTPIPYSDMSVVVDENGTEYKVGIDPAAIKVTSIKHLPRTCDYRAEHIVSQNESQLQSMQTLPDQACSGVG